MIWLALIAVAIAGSLLDRLIAPPRFIDVKVEMWNSAWLYDYNDEVIVAHPRTDEVMYGVVTSVYENHLIVRLPA